MKHTSLSLLSFLLHLSGQALAQNCVATALAVIPSCAQNCILNGAPSIGCGGTDFDCQCQQTAALYAAVEGCVQSSCPTASYQAVIDGASTGKFGRTQPSSSLAFLSACQGITHDGTDFKILQYVTVLHQSH